MKKGNKILLGVMTVLLAAALAAGGIALWKSRQQVSEFGAFDKNNLVVPIWMI